MHFRAAPAPSLWDAVCVVRDLLAHPEYSPPFDEATAREVFSHHTAGHDCDCLASRSMPVPYETFTASTPSQQEAYISTFNDTMHQSEVAMHERGVQHTVGRWLNARLWARQTSFPELYDDTLGWQRDWFAPSFLAAIDNGGTQAIRSIVRTEAPGVYSFDLFTPAFCRKFAADIKLYEASNLPKARPNSMNNYGVIVNDIGMERMIDRLMSEYIQPVARALLAEVTTALALDHHHSFIVQYREGHDLSLDMHTDDSDVTLNVNICDGFTGSGLTFCGRHGQHLSLYPNLSTHFTYNHTLFRRG